MRFLTPKEALVRFFILMLLGWLLIEAPPGWTFHLMCGIPEYAGLHDACEVP
jgi:hypothetical protein